MYSWLMAFSAYCGGVDRSSSLLLPRQIMLMIEYMCDAEVKYSRVRMCFQSSSCVDSLYFQYRSSYFLIFQNIRSTRTFSNSGETISLAVLSFCLSLMPYSFGTTKYARSLARFSSSSTLKSSSLKMLWFRFKS